MYVCMHLYVYDYASWGGGGAIFVALKPLMGLTHFNS